MDSSSFSGSSKRAKALGNLAPVANCLVDGCSADLSLCRDYHRRHKVCEAHSKTPRVTIAGREQRFCQQCSRFHSLVEFDEGKRSCRKRLDGHNRRRRKPLPESLPRATQRIVSFSNTPQMLGVSSVMSGYSWSGAVKPDQEMGVARNTHPHHHQMNYIETAASSFPKRSDKSGYEAQLMQGSEVAIQEASISQPPFLDAAAAAGSSSSSCFSQVVDSDGALSLLSSAIPPARLNNTLMDYHLPHQTKPDAHSTAAPTFHFPEMFPEGSSTGDSHQTLSFMWE